MTVLYQQYATPKLRFAHGTMSITRGPEESLIKSGSWLTIAGPQVRVPRDSLQPPKQGDTEKFNATK